MIREVITYVPVFQGCCNCTHVYEKAYINLGNIFYISSFFCSKLGSQINYVVVELMFR